ncbi:cytochrome b561 [Palleronia marisminoris]|uniref:Cytochrome b561 bacterial/Ni-hydrogenase domain-containing protein n=1 Tax=Palleronia marisminoris TaxID=315423 RepID=A0A1Y5TKB1_9RHOB|nr:cytochrome b [Palleronia marisminoris]SFH42201.1 cytochrome b561 [Palleronia marisminoris]SLN65601.1 hypothetical protein PAM7066_03276 [Palleronia marisminoris]
MGIPGLLDSRSAYGLVSRILHWSLALMLLWQLTGMAVRALLGRHPVSAFFVGMHQSLGTAIFVLVILRIVWMLAMRGRRPDHGNGLPAVAAKAGHAALYALMLLVPSVALVRAFGTTRGFAPFGIELAPPREEDVEALVWLGNAVHGTLGWVLAALIGGHVVAVLIHEALLRDGTLRRMAGRTRNSTAGPPSPGIDNLQGRKDAAGGTDSYARTS